MLTTINTTLGIIMLTCSINNSVEIDKSIFPELAKKEIEANHKTKAKMLKQLVKMDKKKYVYIQAGSFDHEGINVSVKPFYMGNTEVTVLEYRTFLFDLLIQERKDEYLAAKPDQDQWMAINGHECSFNQPMVDHYFSHEAYDEYPVNNIRREGAELYCKWIYEEIQKLNAKKIKNAVGEVRIPTDLEWMYAAYGGSNKQEVYPWNTNSIQNSKSCYLANYKPIVSDSNNLLVNKYIADGAFYTAKADSYMANGYGLYCMSGNLAEMVHYYRENIPGTKGGGWLNDKADLKITKSDLYKGVISPHVNIGFRIVYPHLEN